MNLDLYQALTLAVTQIFLGGIYVMLLMEFRQPVRIWRLRWLVLVCGIVAANVVWVALGHFDFYARFGVLILVTRLPPSGVPNTGDSARCSASPTALTWGAFPG